MAARHALDGRLQRGQELPGVTRYSAVLDRCGRTNGDTWGGGPFHQLQVGGLDQLADRFDQVTGSDWQRTGRRSDGAVFTVETFGKYF